MPRTVRRLGVPGVAADRAAYRQRWKVEAVMAVVKRRCGEALTARLDETQRTQAPRRGVAYNVQRLVRLGGVTSRFRQSKRFSEPV